MDVQAVTSWDTPLSKVLGKDAAKLCNGLDVRTVGQLLSRYPRRVLRAGEASSLDDLVPGERANVVVTVRNAAVHSYRNKRTGRQAYRVEVEAALSNGAIWMTFFD